MTNEIVPMSGTFIAPVIDVDNALRAYQGMKDFVGKVLRENVDYGVIPGTEKPTLQKPGAEKLARFFGLAIDPQPIFVVEDWTGADHNGEPFFFYRYKAIATRNSNLVAAGIGSCSSWEKKYRYRNADLVCPACDKPNIRKSKQGDGWYCWAKTGGCGATFKNEDKRIADQPRGQINNPDPADIVNTIDKMAQKRAIVAAVLLACNASEYFTQDVEDYIEGEIIPPTTTKAPETPVIKAKPAQTPQTSYSSTPPAPEKVVQPDGGNGHGAEYTGNLAKLGKNQYPSAWVKVLMTEVVNHGANQYEVDGILQKLQLTAASEPEAVVEKVRDYLANKANAS
jgi:hypothetical protein